MGDDAINRIRSNDVKPLRLAKADSPLIQKLQSENKTEENNRSQTAGQRLENRIKHKLETMYSASDWASGRDGRPCRAKGTLEYVSDLLIRGRQENDTDELRIRVKREDRPEAIRLCKVLLEDGTLLQLNEKYTKNISGTISPYFKNAAKGFLAMVYLDEVNDGELGVGQASLILDLSRDAYNGLLGIKKAKKKSENEGASATPTMTSIQYGFDPGTQETTAISGETQEYDNMYPDYALSFKCKITEGKAMKLRRQNKTSEGYTDKDIENVYKVVLDANVDTLRIRNTSEKEEKKHWIRTLQAIALVETASLRQSSQEATSIKEGIGMLRTALDSFNKLENEVNGIDGYREKLLVSPKNSFDYYMAKLILADMLVKLAYLNGDMSGMDEALQIYKDCMKVNFDTGKYGQYISIWASMGRINYALATDNFGGMELPGITDADIQPEAKSDKNKTAKTAKEIGIEKSIKYLEEKRKQGALPYTRYMGISAMLLEGNVRVMAAHGGAKAAEAIEVINKGMSHLDSINDREARAELEARGNLLLARAHLITTQDTPNHSGRIAIIGSAEKQGTVIWYLRKAESSAAEAKTMDEAFFAELYYTYASAKSQAALEYKAWADERMENISSDADPMANPVVKERMGRYNELLKEATENNGRKYDDGKKGFYDVALIYVKSNKNFSPYDKKTRISSIPMEQLSLQALQISTRKGQSDVAVKQSLSDLDSYDVKRKEIKVPFGDDEQSKHLRSLLAKTEMDIFSTRYFLLHNSNKDAGPDKTVNGGEMKNIYNHAADMLKNKSFGGLTSGEMKFVYQTLIGMTMVMLNYKESGFNRTRAIDDLKKYYDVLHTLDVSMNYPMAEAFSLIAMENHDRNVASALIGYFNAIAKAEQNMTGAKAYARIGDLRNWVLSILDGGKSDEAELKEALKCYKKAGEMGDKSLDTAMKMVELDLRLVTMDDLRRDVQPGKRQEVADKRIRQYKTALGTKAAPGPIERVISSRSRMTVNSDDSEVANEVKAKMTAWKWKGNIAMDMVSLLDLKLIRNDDARRLSGLSENSAVTAETLLKKAGEYFQKAIQVYNDLQMDDIKKQEYGMSGASVYNEWATAVMSAGLNVDPMKDINTRTVLLYKGATDSKGNVTSPSVAHILDEGRKVSRNAKDSNGESLLMNTETNLMLWDRTDKWDSGNLGKAETKLEESFKLRTGKSMADIAAQSYAGIDAMSLNSYAQVRTLHSYNQPVDSGMFKDSMVLLNKVIESDKGEAGMTDISAAAFMRRADLYNASPSSNSEKVGEKALPHLERSRKDLMNALDILLGIKTDTKPDKERAAYIVEQIRSGRTGKKVTQRVMEALCLLSESEVRIYNIEVMKLKHEGNATEAAAQWNVKLDLMNKIRDILVDYVNEKMGLRISRERYYDQGTGIKYLGRILARRLAKDPEHPERSDPELAARLQKICYWRAVVIHSGAEKLNLSDAKEMTENGMREDRNGNFIEGSDYNNEEKPE